MLTCCGAWAAVKHREFGSNNIRLSQSCCCPPEVMSSEHLPFSRRDLVRSASDGSDGHSQRLYAKHLDQAPEDQVLRLLLEAFPKVSLESIAGAFAKACGDYNLAAEILAVDVNKNCDNDTSKFVEKCQSPPESDRNYEHRMFMKTAPKVVHSDDFGSREAETNQVKNGHGDFAGVSVWRDSFNLSSHSSPPDSRSGPSVKSDSPEDRIFYDDPASDKKKAIRIGKLLEAAPIYEYQGTSNSTARINGPFPGVVLSSQKLSATTGSVSSQMQRRTRDTSGIVSSVGVTVERETELDDGLYSGKLRKKKKEAGRRKAGEELKPKFVPSQRDRDNEDFVHSIIGGEFGIDVVRDVLDHFAGDTDKALDTLLNMGSTSSGVHCIKDAEKSMDPLVSFLGYQEAIDMDLDKSVVCLTADYVPNQEAQEATETLLGQEDQFSKDLLLMMCEAFPTVEQSSLAAVLEAAEFSYEGAVDILKDSGMTPVNEKMLQPKLDPAEVLQALFRSDSGPHEVAASPSSDPLVTAERWNVVAARPRSRRSPVVQAVAGRLKSNSNGEWNEYARQRSSANEHWETMKKYMKEAAAAYNQGDRFRAGVLSEKGAKFKQLAQEASNRASQNIFALQNQDIENNITIDLHAQHVKESLQLLKLHMRSLWQIPSVHVLSVITGQGSHSVGGRAKIKPALTKYLEKKRYPYTELNAGCIHINMSDLREMESRQSSESSSDDE